MQQYRVQFDFEIAFTNGGGLKGWEFRLDIEGNEIADEALAAYIIADLRLLMVGEVRILNKQIIAEAHKRKLPEQADLSTQLLDLREQSISPAELFEKAAVGTVRVIAPDGESYLIRRAAG